MDLKRGLREWTAFFKILVYSGRIFVAEQEEVNRICEEYNKVEDKYGLFERMFIQLFLEEEIELSVHFGLDNLEEDSLRKDQRFRTHVGKFQRFLTGILEMLSKGPEQAQDIVQVLRYSGRIFVAEQEEVNRICEEYNKVEDKYGLFERMFIQLFLPLEDFFANEEKILEISTLF
ncbi:hypothetical protein NECAME_15372 [Necator americanus]|uniref:Uncharacterized protein n=1 Tax=Necator americanus TaxID=51031 RepID=W2SID9_NECAM|nr:hypothetical protein NECAME_15372 [Necator americanus]ETN69340.1 hypothetical protein NECAME_15372 [Necator americanus]